jgi:hypothetical protein
MRLVISHEEYCNQLISYQSFTSSTLSPVTEVNVVGKIVDPRLAIRCREILVESRPGLFYVAKSRTGPNRYIDLTRNNFLASLLSKSYLEFFYADPNLNYFFKIKNCKYLLEVDIVDEKFKFLNYMRNPVPFDEFLSRVGAEASRPFAYDLDLYRR